MPKKKVGRLSAAADMWEQINRASVRMTEAPRAIDPRTTDIIAAHFNLEREMELAIERLVPRPRELDRLSFGHKVAVLKALLYEEMIDPVAEQLLALNELRNAAAHPRDPDLRPLIKKLHRLLEAGLASDGEQSDVEVLPSLAEALSDASRADVIASYAAAIAAALQVVVGAEIMARAALWERASKPRKVRATATKRNASTT